MFKNGKIEQSNLAKAVDQYLFFCYTNNMLKTACIENLTFIGNFRKAQNG